MNDLTKILTNSFTPILGLVVYESKDDFTTKSKFYIESHDIEDGKVMQGKPLLQSTIQSIVDTFFDERNSAALVSGMMPENLLSFTYLPGGNYKMVWYRPAEERFIHFVPTLKINSTKAYVPATLYVVQGNSLKVFALKSNNRPRESTKLYYPPYLNTSDGGSVCLGNAKIKKPSIKTYENLMKYWEDLFWLSEFSHINGSHNKTVTDLVELWRGIMKMKIKPKWSELNELIAIKNKTLKDIV